MVTSFQLGPTVELKDLSLGQTAKIGKFLGFLAEAIRSRTLYCNYRPFDAVDGSTSTAFTIQADDKMSSGDDWLMLDLEKMYTVDRYVVISTPQDPQWRPGLFTIQKSDDGFIWTDLDLATMNVSERVERVVPAFCTRYVRLCLPKGKPFSIAEFELYYRSD